MKAEALSLFHLPMLSVMGLMIFFTFFMAMLFWVFNRQRKPFYLQVAQLPLGDE